MSHVDYSRDWKKSQRYIFRSKNGRYKALKQRKRHERLKQDTSHLTHDEWFELTRCKAKSIYADIGVAFDAAIDASRLIGPCRVYKCPICGEYHLTSHIEEEQE